MPTYLQYTVQINNCDCPEVRKGVKTISKILLHNFEEIVL